MMHRWADEHIRRWADADAGVDNDTDVDADAGTEQMSKWAD